MLLEAADVQKPHVQFRLNPDDIKNESETDTADIKNVVNITDRQSDAVVSGDGEDRSDTSGTSLKNVPPLQQPSGKTQLLCFSKHAYFI